MKNGLIIFGLLLGAYIFFPEKSISHGPGAVAPDVPIQVNTTERNPRPLNGFEISDLASFDITARILSTKTYSYGKESDISPLDLALGWGCRI